MNKRKKTSRAAMAVAAAGMAAAASLAGVGTASAGTPAPVRPYTAGPTLTVPVWLCCGVPADWFTNIGDEFDPVGEIGGHIGFGG